MLDWVSAYPQSQIVHIMLVKRISQTIYSIKLTKIKWKIFLKTR